MTQPAPAEFPIRDQVSSFIDGRFTHAGGYELPVIHPGDARRISTLVEASADEVDAAVRSARAAFDDGRWRRRPVETRQAVMRKVADLVDRHRDELAYLECMNSGIPMRHLQKGQIPRAAYNFRFFAEFLGQHAEKLHGQTDGYLTLVLREPVGVAALIGPWNAPLALTSMKIAGAIAFGNSCVCKPSEVTPLAVARFMELLIDAGVPPGVVNLVNGRGAVTGEALVAHPQVDLVSFTGGTQTARRISASAGEGLKPLSLELGGKSANIIFESADLDRAVDGALVGIFSNNGQQCLAGSRILVQRPVLDRFVEAFAQRAARLRIGSPLDPATEIGPWRSGPTGSGWRGTWTSPVPTARDCYAAARRSRRWSPASTSSRPRCWRGTIRRASAGRKSLVRSPPSCRSIRRSRPARSPTTASSAWCPTCGATTNPR